MVAEDPRPLHNVRTSVLHMAAKTIAETMEALVDVVVNRMVWTFCRLSASAYRMDAEAITFSLGI